MKLIYARETGADISICLARYTREALLVYRFTSDLDNLRIGWDLAVNHSVFQFRTSELSVRNNSDGVYRFGIEFGGVVNPVNSVSFSAHGSSCKRDTLIF
jgi:hypothetical protein